MQDADRLAAFRRRLASDEEFRRSAPQNPDAAIAEAELTGSAADWAREALERLRTLWDRTGDDVLAIGRDAVAIGQGAHPYESAADDVVLDRIRIMSNSGRLKTEAGRRVASELLDELERRGDIGVDSRQIEHLRSLAS